MTTGTTDRTGTTYAPTTEDVRPARSRHTERGPVAALILFLAMLPLEWMTVSSLGGGFIKPFHVAAAIFAVACLARWRPWTLLGPALRRYRSIYGAYFVLIAVAVAARFVYTAPYFSTTLVVRQLTYVSAGVVITGGVAMMIGGRSQRWLAWAGIVATAVLIAAMTSALVLQSMNPISILSAAITQADPDIITYQLLRATFRTDPGLEEAAASLRHKVFIGLLIGLFLSLACSAIIDRRHRLARITIAVGSVVGFAVVLLSLSRSTTLCLAIPLLLYPLRLLVRNRARPAQAVTLVVAITSLLAAAISPIGQILFVRFAETRSYSSRLEAVGPSFLEDFTAGTLVGVAAEAVEKAPHNFVLDSWLGGGVLAGAAAVVMLLSLAWLWLLAVRRYLTDGPGWVVPVHQLWVLGLGAIPLVRAFTSGSQFHMVDFAAIALFLGIVLANERAAASARRQAVAAPSPVAQ